MRTFSTFFQENYSLVVGVAQRRLDSAHDAEDIATEAFRIAWEHYQAGELLSVPWLYGVVRNLVGDEYRRRGRRGALQRQLNDDFRLSRPESDELYADLIDAVERLPLAHREVLKMTYWDGLSAPEIATVLETSGTAVRARLMRARRLLRAELMEIDSRARTEVNASE